jgi:phage terminase large subunit-like protein
MSAPKAIRFIQSLQVPTGPKAGRRIKLGGFQKTFIRGAMAKDTTVAALAVARGNAKSVLASGLGLGELLGERNPGGR